MTKKTLHGIVNGRTIELSEEPGVPTGQQVEVVVTAVPQNGSTWGEGLRRCAGALANDWSDEDDRVLQVIYDDRKQDARPELSK
jgi:hypothetical protein